MKKRSSKKVPRVSQTIAKKVSMKKKVSASSGRGGAGSQSAKKPPVSAGRTKSPANYRAVLADMQRLIANSRHRALATVNRELVCLYWSIGRLIVQQQEMAKWGDSVVEQLASDLRLAFPDMKGLSRDNVFRMRQFFVSCRDLDGWFEATFNGQSKVGAAPRLLAETGDAGKVGAARRQLASEKEAALTPQSTLIAFQSSVPSRMELCAELADVIGQLSWTGHHIIMGAVPDPAERYFYLSMSARERWSVRELRRQIDSGLYVRYMSVRRDPEKCLPADAERGDLLPFKDHYILEFLGLTEEHTEHQLRQAILTNLREFFLEFGRDLTFVGEEYPLTVGNDTFRIDLLFFHRRLQCLLSVELKIGDFLPEYVGKSLFYVAALDEQIRLPHEQPSIGLVLCRNADDTQVRLALSPAAKKVGVATYETALPDARLIRQRLEQIVIPKEEPK